MVQPNVGISAMHMQLLHTDEVVMFDRTDFGPSKLVLPADQCDAAGDCTAHSILYSSLTNAYRPLTLQTDTWCSSGAALPNGTLVQTGGFNAGERVVRLFTPSSDWTEYPGYLAVRRWYATNQLLPDGRVIILGGRRQFSYEFFPSTGAGAVHFPFLQETRDDDENNLYPFLHLLPDGRLFVFANTRAVLFDYDFNVVVRRYPPIPGGDPRNYPSTGSSALLPLRLDRYDAGNIKAEILVCGGAPPGSLKKALAGEFVKALTTCARIAATDANPMWEMEEMPVARVMGDMLLLPTGDVLLINGAESGTAGWELGRDPVLAPVLYRPEQPAGGRFRTLRGTAVPRMYHSSAVVLSDGRVLVGGSNPHVYYNFTGVLYPTDLSLESFSPPYLSPEAAVLRPELLSVSPADEVGYGELLTVQFRVPVVYPRPEIAVTLLFPSFTTHSLAMNQRHLVLHVDNYTEVTSTGHQLSVVAPPSSAVAPPGYYMMFVVHGGVPSQGKWIKIR